MTRSSDSEPEPVNDACKPRPSGIDDTQSNTDSDEETEMEEDVQEDDSDTGSAAIDRQAVEISSSLVKTCLSQLCKCLQDSRHYLTMPRNIKPFTYKEKISISYTLLTYLATAYRKCGTIVCQQYIFQFTTVLIKKFHIFIILYIFLTPLGVLNSRKFVVTDENQEHEDQLTMSEDLAEFKQVHKTVILSPGKVISMTVLNQRGSFRHKTVSGIKGKTLMAKASKQFDIEK